MYVRRATPDDVLDIRRILDAALLEPGDVEDRIATDDVLVAGDRRGGTGEDDGEGTERVLGTIVLEPRDRGSHIAAIGVRRRHRNRGIGRALVVSALERDGRLTARFDDGVKPFYESLGFAIEPIDDERHRGIVDSDEDS